GSRSRTGVHGFAGRCMTTLPSRRGSEQKGKAHFSHGALPLESGAGNESRTRDLNLGKVALYQLSYSRKHPDYIKREPPRKAAPCASSKASTPPSARRRY